MQVSGLGAGVDSYYEILLKSFIMFGEPQVRIPHWGIRRKLYILLTWFLSSGCRDVPCFIWQDQAIHATRQVLAIVFNRNLTYIPPGPSATQAQASTPCTWTSKWEPATPPPTGLTVCRQLSQAFRWSSPIPKTRNRISAGAAWGPGGSNLSPCSILLNLEEIWLFAWEVSRGTQFMKNSLPKTTNNCLADIIGS